MTASYRKLVESPGKRVEKEDWDEWESGLGECFSGRKEILGMFTRLVQAGAGEAPLGALYVKSNASVLVIAEFGMTARDCVDWKPPLPPPESLEGGERFC
jgi:hypothetical protein